MSFLNQINPDLAVTILTAIAAGATWLFRKARGEKTQTARELLENVVTQVLNSDGVDLENVREKLEARLRAALAKRGIKGKLAERLVHEFVEWGAAELHERYDGITRNLERMYKAAEGVGGELKKLERAQDDLEKAVQSRSSP